MYGKISPCLPCRAHPSCRDSVLSCALAVPSTSKLCRCDARPRFAVARPRLARFRPAAPLPCSAMPLPSESTPCRRVALRSSSAAARGLAFPSPCISVHCHRCALQSRRFAKHQKPQPRAALPLRCRSPPCVHCRALPLLRIPRQAAAAPCTAVLSRCAGVLSRSDAGRSSAPPVIAMPSRCPSAPRRATPCFAVALLRCAEPWHGWVQQCRCRALVLRINAEPSRRHAHQRTAKPSRRYAVQCGAQPLRRHAHRRVAKPLRFSAAAKRSSTFSGARAIRTCRDRCCATGRFP